VKLFSCQKCSQVLFFENTVCTNCGQPVAFSVEANALVATPRDEAKAAQPFEVKLPKGKSALFSRCKNFVDHDACNWLVAAADHDPYCRSCRLTEELPDLNDAQDKAAWLEIERAKRRMLYSLYAMKLPVVSKAEDPLNGMQFRFLRGTQEKPVMTGHDEGIITLNIAEANDSFRENMREMMGEAYRTVLGHLRHEIGHYYWDRLVRGRPSLGPCRALFGDESVSYEESLKRHYEQGPPANWRESYISSYATMHPWEDWAETWAHYMHMTDTLETAKAHGLTVRVPGQKRGSKVATDALAFTDFEALSNGWHGVILALNDLNRSMGVKDVYPFVLSPVVHRKIGFVHALVQGGDRAVAHHAKPAAKPSRSLSSLLPGWLRSPEAHSASTSTR
jgi:hypothetical protein